MKTYDDEGNWFVETENGKGEYIRVEDVKKFLYEYDHLEFPEKGVHLLFEEEIEE
jgi:hypothetical protein